MQIPHKILLTFSLLLAASNASAIELCGKKSQGEILTGFAPEDIEQILLNEKEIMISEDGFFLMAFEREAPKNNTLMIITNHDEDPKELEIAAAEWDIQNLAGLPARKVTPSKEDEREISRERTDIRGAQSELKNRTDWKKGFILPVEGRTSGKFGGQRIMNGEKRNPHMGMDIAAPEGTPIKASSKGTVTLAGFDYFYSGNTVVIDHGQGLFTIYAHMKDTNVKKGDKVRTGDIIGTVGKTGRVTGAHLHWGASLNGVRFNPSSLLNINNRELCSNL